MGAELVGEVAGEEDADAEADAELVGLCAESSVGGEEHPAIARTPVAVRIVERTRVRLNMIRSLRAEVVMS
ncbi:hypothetical protein [Mobilicoccus pelagius]|uniref:hypothetical protein n=1 Tax=Mobilicoccus pelagius TaxID=746032 RepID=UPI0002E5F721|nr:hypothetical protein [Mobilicoccus pelagius]